MMKRNFKFVLSYDGTKYYGWEHQPNNPMTIQGKLEAVLSKMTGGADIKVIGAGRTDAGVHARAMTANAALETPMNESEVMAYMNRYLPDDISINDVKVASERFHSRYMAKGKTYRYTLWTGSSKPVFDRKYVTVLEENPDTALMERAASFLVGTHDFKSFCSNPHMKKSTVRSLDTIKIERSGSYIRIYYHGNGFLRSMVRIITGTLLEVGFGRLKIEEISDILEAKDRSLAGPTSPAQGLCLMKVDY